jgi:hypothetical protein
MNETGKLTPEQVDAMSAEANVLEEEILSLSPLGGGSVEEPPREPVAPVPEPSPSVVEPEPGAQEDLGEEVDKEEIKQKVDKLIDETVERLNQFKGRPFNVERSSLRDKIKETESSLRLFEATQGEDFDVSIAERRFDKEKELRELEKRASEIKGKRTDEFDVEQSDLTSEYEKELSKWKWVFENFDEVNKLLKLSGDIELVNRRIKEARERGSDRGDNVRELENMRDGLYRDSKKLKDEAPQELLKQEGWKIAEGELTDEGKMTRGELELVYQRTAKDLYELFNKMRGEEVKVEELETPEVAEAEAPAPAPELVTEEVSAVEPEAEALGELQPEIPEAVEPVEEALKVETIEEVKQRTRGEIERFKRIKSPEAFGSVLKNMTDYVHFLEGDSKNKFVEFATRFVKNNLDLTRESVDGIPEEFKGSKIEDIPEDAKKDSWWTLIFFLLELGLATSETVVNEAVTAINE